jgi:hypothetical protein
MGTLKQVAARVPAPAGWISVQLNRQGDHLIAGVTLPRGMKGTIEWGGKSYALRGGPQRFAL